MEALGGGRRSYCDGLPLRSNGQRPHAGQFRLPLLCQRPFEERRGCRLRLTAAAPGLVQLLGHELRPGEQGLLRLSGLAGAADAGTVMTAGDQPGAAPEAVAAVAVGPVSTDLNAHRLTFDSSPAAVDQQRFGVCRDTLGPLEHRLDRVGVLLAGDEFPRQGQQQVVALVAVGGEPVLGQFTLDRERRLQLLRDQLERVGLERVAVGREHDLDWLGLTDSPGTPGRLAHGVDRVVGLEPADRAERDQVEAGLDKSRVPDQHFDAPHDLLPDPGRAKGARDGAGLHRADRNP